MTDGTLFTGKTVEDAIAEGLRSLGATQDQVEVDVVSRGSRGLFGIGSEPAQVRVTLRALTPVPPAPPVQVDSPPAPKPLVAEAPAMAAVQPNAEPVLPLPTTVVTAVVAADAAPGSKEDVDDAFGDDAPPDEVGDAEMAALSVHLLSETVQLMGFEAEVVASWQEPDADNDDRYLLLNLHGRDLGALIGRRGETLTSLQYLLRLMVNQRFHQWKNIVVDVEQYRQHRAEHLAQLALRSADQVTQTGRPLSLEPMPSNERRIIHLALRDHPTVFTESSGEGDRRKIQILPRRA
jgi:spoIIIJ-associated protein